MDIKTKRVFYTPSVKFDEESFPGLITVNENTSLFPFKHQTKIGMQNNEATRIPVYDLSKKKTQTNENENEIKVLQRKKRPRENSERKMEEIKRIKV